ncbi:hypothetical protein PVAND_017328 [Polypedilum vanderplanki]|uniref:Uncharacterized protein n=1 Tax=Polypedilum vanderplanki TaxID=319348 RepID=A0A9J6BHS0_POLVA|nr:hypothetical protein PVAND_017328 [Polypedilum vanderplanki]
MENNLDFGEFYRCNNEMVLSFHYSFPPKAKILAVIGRHLPSKNNSHVEDMSHFNAATRIKHFFPNLVKIYIEKGDMTEIHQAHLRNLTKLKYLSLPKNEIKKIEKNLFKFNTELEILNLEENLIKEIYPTVFDDLKKLSIITLWKNQCTNFNGSNKNEIIKEIQENCKPAG